MNKMFKFAIGAGLALTPWAAFAQAPADQPASASAPTTVTSAVIPPDQQPSKEQLEHFPE
jgi:ABC-type glycerol-3-phosphate transport system substrate-binding protein